MLYDAIRLVILVETSGVLLAYVWAAYELFTTPRAKDATLRAMRLGRICRVLGVIVTLLIFGSTIVARFGKEVVAWQLIPWQIVIFFFMGAWITLDRQRYYSARHDERAPAAGRALVSLVERER